MLAARNRLTSGQDFRAAIKGGARSGSGSLVVHWLADGTDQTLPEHLRVGLVVSKAVGPAVVRNRVKRRLRHLVRDRLVGLPPRGLVVVRALPKAASASYDQLGAELDRLLARCVEGTPVLNGAKT